MRFDEINDNSMNNNRRPMKKKRFNNMNLIIIGVVAFVVLLILLLVLKGLSSKPSDEPVTPTIDTDSRISRMLYKKVHDFDNKEPFWMYSDDGMGLISEMKETTKMSLVYINLKFNDFNAIECKSIPNVDSYDNYQCTDNTIIISRDVIEDTYKDLFGSDSEVSLSSVMKVDEKGNQAYFYEEELDGYILLKRKNEIEKEKNYIHKYEFIKAVSTDEKIVLYEVVSQKNLTTGKVKKNRYVYTFVIDDDGLYNYYSIEKDA